MTDRVARTAAWLSAAAACTIPLLALPGSFPTAVLIALVIYGAIALVRPVDALLILTGLGPVAGVASGLAGGPFDGGRILEAAVLILIVGWCLRGAASGANAAMTAFDWALLAFAAVAAISLAARGPVLVLLVGHDSLSAVWSLVRRGYFDRFTELTAVTQTALLVEGTVLAAIASRVARADDGARLASAVVIGAAGAATLGIYRLLEVTLRQPQFLEGLWNLTWRFRIAPQYADLNAAGSYFALTALVALTLAGRGSSRRPVALVAAILIAGALWLSGSRVALAAALATSGVLLAIRPGSVRQAFRGRPGVAISGVVVLAALLVAPFVYSGVRSGNIGYSLFTRLELLKTGLRMVADRPVFGAGTAQFYDSFPRYTSPALLREFQFQLGVPVTNENAHNNFLQIVAELGIVGLAAFAAVLVLALRGSLESSDRLRRGAALALLAFLLTCLAGHPLLTHLVAYPFWTVLGLAAGLAPASAGPLTAMRRVAVAGIVLLLATLPWRTGYERREAYLEGLTFGFSNWELDEAGTRFHWAGERATLFVRQTVRLVQFPLKSPDRLDRVVRVEVNGRPGGEIRVPAGLWTEARIPMPTSERPLFRRLDLVVMPAADVGEGDNVRRVMVGRALLVPDPGQAATLPPDDAASPRPARR